MKNERISKILTFGIIAVFFGLFFVIYYYREPFGDDILIFYDNGLSYYLDKTALDLGTRTTSFAQVMSQVVSAYNVWTGRVLGYVIMLSCGLLGLWVRSFLTALWITLIVFLCVSLIHGDFKKALQKPLSFITVYMILFWYSNAAGHVLMWTISSIYLTAMVLCLLYLYCFEKMVERRFQLQKKEIILFTVIGLLAGLTHEIFAAILLGMVFYKTIWCILHKTACFRKLFLHIGLVTGYLICFLAPGNFNRLQQSHEGGIRSVSLAERLLDSVKAHVMVLQPTNYFGRFIILAVLALFMTAFFLSMRKNGLSVASKEFLRKNDIYLVGALLSILLWGAVSTVPKYGLVMWTALVVILLMKNITLPEKAQSTAARVATGLSFLILVAVLTMDIPWMKSYADTTVQRRTLIESAVSDGKIEVVVPRYPEQTNRDITLVDFQNDQNQFGLDYYIDFYRIRIIVGN